MAAALTPAAVGSATQLTIGQKHEAGYFAPHWTHMVGAKNLGFFYNSNTGEAAIGVMGANQTPSTSHNAGEFRTTKVYPKNAFAKGFTHIVCSEDSSNQHP